MTELYRGIQLSQGCSLADSDEGGATKPLPLNGDSGKLGTLEEVLTMRWDEDDDVTDVSCWFLCNQQ